MTISVNAMLKKGKSSIEIAGLTNASFPFGGSGRQVLNVSSASAGSPLDHLRFCASATDSECEPGTATFDNSHDLLELQLAADAGCGETFIISFCVFNPDKFLSPVCTWQIAQSHESMINHDTLPWLVCPPQHVLFLFAVVMCVGHLRTIPKTRVFLSS